jgi:hypothetical protein
MGAETVQCAAFGADGALARALLESPVNGRALGAGGEATAARLGDQFAAGDTLLVFLRHLG